ncbi:MAG TPA: lysine--tRNA ligase [Trebonia sp.]
MAETPDSDWVARFADEVITAADRYRPGKPVVCASGLSPSGPVHLGNLREVLTPHLVADEIRRRGVPCEHIISWDDYDRFRRVPATIDPSWAEHVGKPLSHVPAPPGSEHANWADHFRAPLLTALAELGVEFRGISQTAMYTSGAYTDQVLLAMRERHRIDAILAEYRTKPKPSQSSGTPQSPGSTAGARDRSADEAAMNALALEGSGAADEDDGASATGYYPYKPYCEVCDRDLTTVTAYDDDTTAMSYTCACGHAATVKLSTGTRGKLVWKVDWPMRWAYEGVAFEPSGVDHTSPGSSYVVGGRLVGDIFGGVQPIGPMYAFVGMAGMAKMSSSKGGVPTPAQALGIMEAPLLRWIYSRKRPSQSITVSFGQELQRMYDEWDALTGRVAAGTAKPAEVAAYGRAAETAAGPLPTTPVRLSFGTLASVYDVTTGQPGQMLRVLRDVAPGQPIDSLDVLRPRLDKAARWAADLPAEQRTQVRTAPDREGLAALDDQQRASVKLLLDGLDADWSLDGLTTLVYGVPKRMLGLPLDVKPTPDLRAAQRSYFALLYQLLVGRDTGPRLPTLLLAIGAERVRQLLSLPAV